MKQMEIKGRGLAKYKWNLLQLAIPVLALWQPESLRYLLLTMRQYILDFQSL